MTYQFDIVEFRPVTLAVTEAFVRQADIPARIPGMLDIAYAWLRESGADRIGNNYAVYDRFSSDGMRMQVGFPVSRRFTDAAQVKCVERAAGRAAHTRHHGAYSGLPDANSRLYEWCTQQSLQIAGVSWEVYGDWHEDESRLVTDIYVQLA